MSANLVAVESLKPGDEILTPWGRDRIDVVSTAYNVAITERKRQIPLKRNGRPNLVKRADPYAASRKTARASVSTFVFPAAQNAENFVRNVKERSKADVGRVDDTTVRVQYTPDLREWLQVLAKNNKVKDVLASRGARAASRKTAKAGAEHRGRPMVTFFRSPALAAKAKRVLLYRYDVESEQKGTELIIQVPRDAAKAKQVYDVVNEIETLRASRKKPAAQANLKLIGLLTVARLAPILRKVGMSEDRVRQLSSTLQKAQTASDAYDKLAKELGSRADYVAKAIGLNEVQEPRVPPGYKTTTVDQLVPGDEIITYPDGKDVVEKVSSQRKAVKTRSGKIIAGKATVYVKASAAGREDFVPSRLQVRFSSAQNAENALRELRRSGVKARLGLDVGGSGRHEMIISMPREPKFARDIYRILDSWDGQASTRYTASRRTASAALPALLAVARVAPILLRFGLSAKNATALANALAKTTTAYEAYQKLRDDVGSGAEAIAKALGLNPEETRVAYQNATAPVAGSRTARAAKQAPKLVRYTIKPTGEMDGDQHELVVKFWTADGKHYEPADYFTNDMNDAKATGQDTLKRNANLSRRSARAGWRGAAEEQQPKRQKFGSLGRMLVQHNVTDPRKLPDEARKSFNALLAAVIKRTDADESDVIGQAMKDAKMYAEQMATSASQRSAGAAKKRGKRFNAPTPRKQMLSVTSLVDLYNKARVDPRYEQLAKDAAENLGGGPRETRSLDAAIQWLELNANETDEQGVVDEINFVAENMDAEMSRGDVRASTIDDMEMAVKLLVDYQVSKPHQLPPDAEREFWSLMSKISSTRRSAPGNEATTAYYRAQKATRASRLAKVACRCAMRIRSKSSKPAVAAAYPGFKDSAKVATLKTFRVSLKVDAREGTYDAARDLAQHIDDALQAAGLNAYDVYVR